MNRLNDGIAKERERCAKIAREIKNQAQNEASVHQSDREAAAAWADCASQILWEIERASA